MTRAVPVRESRLEIERQPDGLRIAFVRRRPWWRFVLPLWIGFIIGFGLIGMLTEETSQDDGAWFLVVWVSIGAVMLALSMWGLLYREKLVLDSHALTHVRSLGPFSRRRAYARDRVEDIRVSPETISPFDFRAGLRMYGVGGGTIAFDYGDRTIRIADVEEAEAKRAVAALNGV